MNKKKFFCQILNHPINKRKLKRKYNVLISIRSFVSKSDKLLTGTQQLLLHIGHLQLRLLILKNNISLHITRKNFQKSLA